MTHGQYDNDKTSAVETAAAPLIDGIDFIELLGKGGTSLVYKARQVLLGRIVAVKVLSKMTISSSERIKRFVAPPRIFLKSSLRSPIQWTFDHTNHRPAPRFPICSMACPFACFISIPNSAATVGATSRLEMSPS